MKLRWFLGATLLVTLLSSLAFAGRVPNGRLFNGRLFNGRELNGRLFNGRLFNGTNLTASFDGGPEISGSALIGRELQAVDESDPSQSIHLRIASYEPAPTGVAHYQIQYEDQAVCGFIFVRGRRLPRFCSKWQPLCGNDAAGNAVRSLLVPGRWDYNSGAKISYSPNDITLSCVGVGAIAKCIEMPNGDGTYARGYFPWESQTMDGLHQACVRMVRADYFGDGRSHTVEGRQIDVFDYWRRQTDSDPSWLPEAVWSAQGALCLSHTRLQNLCREYGVSYPQPHLAVMCGGALDPNVSGNGPCIAPSWASPFDGLQLMDSIASYGQFYISGYGIYYLFDRVNPAQH